MTQISQETAKKLLEALNLSIHTICDIGINLPSGVETTKNKVEFLKKVLAKAEAEMSG